ncbi:hypothetical protein JNK13_08225 [bacterium]|nr:hypothetical protein [bacterium]
MKFLIAICKRLLSHFKKEWNFEDYPVETWELPNASDDSDRVSAGIINWPSMVERGSTAEEAIKNLKEDFLRYKEHNTSLPRPGTKVPLKFAPTAQMDKYEDVAVDYFEKVLRQDYYDGFYSDGSCFNYFEPVEDEEGAKQFKEMVINRTREIYDIDVSDIYDGPLYAVLARIKNKQ